METKGRQPDVLLARHGRRPRSAPPTRAHRGRARASPHPCPLGVRGRPALAHCRPLPPPPLLLPRHRDAQALLRGDQVVGVLGVFAQPTEHTATSSATTPPTSLKVSNRGLAPANLRDEVRGTAVGNKSPRFIFVYQYGNMGRTMSCAMASTPRSRSRRSRGHPAMERTRTGEVGIEKPRTEKNTAT